MSKLGSYTVVLLGVLVGRKTGMLHDNLTRRQRGAMLALIAANYAQTDIRGVQTFYVATDAGRAYLEAQS